LSSVVENLRIGQPVEAGETLGLIGASGAPAGAANAGAEPHLHFELLDANGKALGDGLEPLEVHAEVARVFGDHVLPRHAREIVAAVLDGQAVPADYPPDPIPSTGFNLEVPSELVGGTAQAIAVSWEGKDFTPDALFGDLNGVELGFIDAGNGAWLLLPAPHLQQTVEATLTVGGADRYGQTLIGRRSILVRPHQHRSPLEVDNAFYQRYADADLEAETQHLAGVVAASLAIRQPLWQQPFRAPVEGRVLREFGQRIVSGVMRPAFPSPGLDFRIVGEKPVVASNRGRVALIDSLPMRGRTVALVHGGGLISVYAGLDQVGVEVGQLIERGSVIGRVGTAEADSSFRWETYLAGVGVDPRVWLDRLLPQPDA
jgi:murein DD-endopeptidase MepM/ murein hydrolase activator NlpD